ncbi:hypothetical protein ACFTZB_44790, partial [Rhodococcus sp. NPDC057014]|uniref:hypothetical protein n=1 Tax=Rhodococcus sp. NPDC057014 TaxID=3346000 RepID=UPI0036255EA5
ARRTVTSSTGVEMDIRGTSMIVELELQARSVVDPEPITAGMKRAGVMACVRGSPEVGGLLRHLRLTTA